MGPIALALVNLWARPARFVLLTLIVTLTLTTAVTLVLLSDSIQEGLREGAVERGADLTVAQRGASDLLAGSVPEQLEAPISRIKGVAGVSGELAMFAPVDGVHQSLVVGWTSDAYFWRDTPIAQGRLPQADEERAAVLGMGVAGVLNKKVGDTIDILGEPFNVVGIAGFASSINRSLIVVRLADLQAISLRPNQVTAFHISLDRKQADAELVKRGIEALGRLSATPTDHLLQSDRNYAFLKAVSNAICLIALAMGSLSVFSALLLAVHERRREIGTLMAIGWSRSRIRMSIIAEGIVIGMIAGVLAIPLAFLVGRLFRHLPGIGTILALKVSPETAALGLLASLLLCVAGSLYPAIRATWMDPAQALRSA